MQQHPRVTFGQQCHIENTPTVSGMMKTYLVRNNGFSGPRRTLDYNDTGFKKATMKNSVKTRQSAGNSFRKSTLVGCHCIHSCLSGSTTVNVDPKPRSLTTEISPRMANTSCRVTHKPTPKPPLDLPEAALINFSKMCTWSHSAMPMP